MEALFNSLLASFSLPQIILMINYRTEERFVTKKGKIGAEESQIIRKRRFVCTADGNVSLNLLKRNRCSSSTSCNRVEG